MCKVKLALLVAFALSAAGGALAQPKPAKAKPASPGQAIADRIKSHWEDINSGDPGRVAAVREALEAESEPQVRRAIVAGLAAKGGPQNRETFLEAFADDSPEVRLEGVVGLGKLGDPEALAALREILSSESNPGIKAAACFWLGAARDSASVPELAEALGDEDRNVRIAAAHALGRLGSAAARSFLRTIEDDPDPKVKAVAARHLK